MNSDRVMHHADEHGNTNGGNLVQHHQSSLDVHPMLPYTDQAVIRSLCAQDLLPSADKTSIYLSSPTKGDMMLIKSSTWEFYENDMPDMDFLPSATAIMNDLEL